MIEKLKSKPNHHDSFNFDGHHDLPSHGPDSLSGWADEKESLLLYFPTEQKKKRFHKISETAPSKAPLRTADSSKNVITTLSSMKNYTRSESMFPTSKVSQMAIFLAKRTRTNLEIQNKIDLMSQANIEPYSNAIANVQSQRKRPASIASYKVTRKIEETILDSNISSVLKAVKAKVIEAEPITYRRSSTGVQSSPVAKSKESGRIRISPRAISCPKDTETSKIKEAENSPRHHIPMVMKKKVPGGCFNAFNNANVKFSRKTYLGISRMVGNGSWLKNSLLEGTSSLLPGESTIHAGNGKEEKTNISETKLYLNRVLLNRESREESRSKAYTPLPKKATWVRDSGSKSDRTGLVSRHMIKMPVDMIETDKLKILTQSNSVLEKLKVKVKSSKGNPKGFMKSQSHRQRSRENLHLDELNIRPTHYENISGNTSLNS